ALVLWAALLWRPRPVAEDLPAAMASGPDIRRLHVLTRAFLASVVLFFLVIILVPSGDILHAQQSNLRVVMPPLLIPGHLFLVLAIFTGCGLLWHHLPAYVWGARAKDPMDPAAKLRLSRTLLTVILIGLVGVNAVRNWQYGDRSRSRIAFLYAGNVTRSFAPDGDTLVINTGDETFLYWYLTKVHWDQNPDQALPDLTFTNWIHQIPNYEILAQSTEAELQRDILLFFLKQQLVERASRALGYESDVKHPTGLATTFFRQEFLQVERFKYWDVVMDGLVYHWNIKPEYEIVAIQDILQTEAQAAEWDRLGDEQVDLLQKRVTQILYDESPAYAAHVNVLQGRAERGGGAAAKADPSTVGPLKRNPDGSVEGTVPHPEDPTGPPLLTLSDDQGPIYQVANLPPVEIQYRDRDWWSFYDWRGVLEVEGTGDTAKVEPTTIIYDPQEQEILARYQDLFYQHALRHFKAAIEVSEQLEALPEPSADGRKDPVYAALEAEWSEAMALADRNATTAILFRFHENSELMTTGWGLLGEIKLRLGQYDRAAQAYQFLTLAIDPAEYPNAAADARASLAYCYAQLGQTGLAQRYAAEALVLDPENPMAKALSQGTPSGAAMPGRPGGLRIPPPTNTPETGEAPPPQPNPELPDPADGTTSPTDGSAGQ
ncbi:MAG TPA: tetratricopeptide repeat protein, partial [bacterium]|nr:tetratricopeptide repeat protein [bacterium]